MMGESRLSASLRTALLAQVGGDGSGMMMEEEDGWTQSGMSMISQNKTDTFPHPNPPTHPKKKTGHRAGLRRAGRIQLLLRPRLRRPPAHPGPPPFAGRALGGAGRPGQARGAPGARRGAFLSCFCIKMCGMYVDVDGGSAASCMCGCLLFMVMTLAPSRPPHSLSSHCHPFHPSHTSQCSTARPTGCTSKTSPPPRRCRSTSSSSTYVCLCVFFGKGGGDVCAFVCYVCLCFLGGDLGCVERK